MEVQVCDFRSDSFKRDFLDSVTNTGFAVITNHGISYELIQMAQRDWKLFFKAESDYKNSFINEEDGNLGFKGIGSEKAYGSKAPDLKEFFHYKPGGAIPDDTYAVTHSLYYQLQDLGMVLLNILDKQMYYDKSFRNSCLDSDNTLFRALYYPARDYSETPDAVRAAAHEDINFITLLVAASAPGLEVLDRNNKWHKVPHEDNSVIVNIGDMLELASGGLFRSTTHRVVNADDNVSDRISMPLFIHPHSQTILAPGITAQEFLDERLEQLYGVK